MSINKKELIKIIEEIAPSELMESWDNTGMQISVENETVNRILVCLDICEDTVNEAIEKGCDFIVSHHPLIFSPMRSIKWDDPKGRLAIRLISRGISAYASHTSFDSVSGGNNDYIAELLELEDVCVPEEEPVMRTGALKEAVSLRQLCETVNSRIMKGAGLSYTGDLDREVRKVGICTGAGADLMSVASAHGCEVLVTGDVKYHDFQRGDELGISIIDAGHFETEIFFAENMGNKLAEKLGNSAEVVKAENQKNWLKRF